MTKQILNKNNSNLGFGFDPNQNQHHFVVIIPSSNRSEVMVHECHTYFEDSPPEAYHINFLGSNATGKISLINSKWQLVENILRIEFNQRLRHQDRKHKSVQWGKGVNFVHRLFGKELMVLLWAIEDAEAKDIGRAIENWLGLKPEERWWLYTVTNAATGHPIHGKGRGWRKALRFALTENPVQEGRYSQSLLDEEKQTLFEQDIDFKAKK